MESKLVEKLLRFNEKKKLWIKGDRLLIACSGGPDSIALVRLLVAIKEKEEIEIGICVVDHGLRKESEGEVAFVVNVAKQFGIPCYPKKINVRARMEITGESLETAARQLRYEVLRSVRKEEHYQYIVTAHHEGDQIETVLAHLFRGSGASGLVGISSKRNDILRPLLHFSKEELVCYLKELGQRYCEDVSNSSLAYTRNRIRHQIVPVLKEEWPHLGKSLQSLSETLEIEETYWQEEVEKTYVFFDEKSQSWDRIGLSKLPMALRYRLYRAIAEAFYPFGSTPTKEHILAMDHVVLTKEAKEFQVQWMKFYQAYDRIYVVSPKKKTGYRLLFLKETEYVEPLGSGMISIPKHIWEAGVEIRHRKPGDRIIICDKHGIVRMEKSLKKVLMEKKMPKQERHEAWFLVANNKVLCEVHASTCYSMKEPGEVHVVLQVVEEEH